MKNQIASLLALAALTLGVISCKSDKKVETSDAKPVAEVVAAETYKAIPAQTFVTWEAKKLVGGHKGTMNASSGVLDIKGSEIVGGNFIIDVNTITCTDIEDADTNEKFIGHLKAGDFFDVAKHPNGAFQITSVTTKEGKTVIAGNLTLKGIKKNIEFPATIAVNGGKAIIKSESFNIDRTEWNVNYNSGKLTDAASLGDKLIKDEVTLTVNVMASK